MSDFALSFKIPQLDRKDSDSIGRARTVFWQPRNLKIYRELLRGEKPLHTDTATNPTSNLFLNQRSLLVELFRQFRDVFRKRKEHQMQIVVDDAACAFRVSFVQAQVAFVVAGQYTARQEIAPVMNPKATPSAIFPI